MNNIIINKDATRFSGKIDDLLLCIIIFSCFLIPYSNALAEKGLVFHLPFDGKLAATVSKNGTKAPINSKGINFVPGIIKNAVTVKGIDAILEYQADQIFNSEEGTVMFWFQPQWDWAPGEKGEDKLSSAGWKVKSGAWDIIDNALCQGKTEGAFNITLDEKGRNIGGVEFDFKLIGISRKKSGYHFGMHARGLHLFSTGRLEWRYEKDKRNVHGCDDKRNFEKGKWHHIKVLFPDNNAEIYIDGKIAQKIPFASQDKTEISFYTYNCSAGFDNVKIYGKPPPHLFFEADFNQEEGSKNRRARFPGESGAFLCATGDEGFSVNIGGNSHSLYAHLLSPDHKMSVLDKRVNDSIFAYEWHHIAVVWEKDGWARLYLDGQFMDETDFSYKPFWKPYWHPKGITNLFIGKKPNEDLCWGWAIDELNIYDKALSKTDIQSIYRQNIPVDFVIYHRFVAVGRKEKIGIEIIKPDALKDVLDDTLNLSIEDSKGEIIWKKSMPVEIKGKEKIDIEVGPFEEEGEYRLNFDFEKNKACYRMRKLYVYSGHQEPQEATDEDIKTGPVEVEIDCGKEMADFVDDEKSRLVQTNIGAYRESGNTKHDRFGYIVELKEAGKGPYVLELTYPDDKTRTFECMIFAKSGETYGFDWLGAGEICGGEFPNTEKIRTVRYIFWPATKSNLVQFTCQVVGEPAAVKSLRLSPVIGRLPKLKINSPEDVRGRSTGIYDEDFIGLPFFFRTMGESRWQQWATTVMRLADYLEYTGAEYFHHPVIHYWHQTHYDGLTRRHGHQCYGWQDLLVRTLGERNIKFIGTVDLFSLPEYYRKKDTLFQNKGQFLLNKKGESVYTFGGDRHLNPIHPEIKEAFISMAKETAEYYSRYPAFKGLMIDMFHYTVLNLVSMECGYEDFTVELFEKETGINIPVDSLSPARFYERYKFLASKDIIDKWLAWRCDKVTGIIKELHDELKKINPDIELYFSSLAGKPDYLISPVADYERASYEAGFDVKSIKQIPGIYLGNMYWTSRYKGDKSYLERESFIREDTLDSSKFRFLKNAVYNVAISYGVYFETRTETLIPKDYASYCQCCDIKPAGRAFLEGYQRHIDAFDPSAIYNGGFAVGTFGREKEQREFTRAFSALPRGEYQDIAGLSDPVRARCLTTPSGIYLYLANRFYLPAKVEIPLAGDNIRAKNLSSGEIQAADGTFATNLLPYELKSFLLTGKGVKILRGSALPQGDYGAIFNPRFEKYAPLVNEAEKNGLDVSTEKEILSRAKRSFEKGEYFEAHRLIFSKYLTDMPKKNELVHKGYFKEMKEMISRGEYRLDCGSYDFWRIKSGKLFFPDQSYKPGGFGYTEEPGLARRSKIDIKNTEDDEIYLTETYIVDSYKFTVKPGKYTMRLHFAVTYLPTQRANYFIFNVDIEGKRMLTDFDIFTAAGGGLTAVVKEFKGVEVDDGILDIVWTPTLISPCLSSRMVNAIEVIPE